MQFGWNTGESACIIYDSIYSIYSARKYTVPYIQDTCTKTRYKRKVHERRYDGHVIGTLKNKSISQ